MHNAEYLKLLGFLVERLQSLEFLLRAYLYAKKDGAHTDLLSGQPGTFKAGDTAPVNAFTDYSSLSKLIERYNKLVQVSDAKLVVEASVVTVRDALAHGRIAFKEEPNGDAEKELLKFEDPKGGSTTKVTMALILTKDWFENQIALVEAQIQKICAAPGAPVEMVRYVK